MKKFDVTQENFTQNMDELRKGLFRLKVNHKEAVRRALQLEEVIEILLANSDDGKVEVRLSSFGEMVQVHIISRGTKVSTEELRKNFLDLEDSDNDEYNTVVQQLVHHVMESDMSIRYFGRTNICTLTIKHFRHASLIRTIGSLLAGLVFGLLLKNFASEAMSSWICKNLLASVSTMFLNALKMVVGPLVFFSMAASIAEFKDLRSLGRIAGKVFSGYLITSMIAIGIGYTVYRLVPIGDPSLMSAVTDAAASTIEKGSGVSISIKDTIVNVIPSSFAEPFVNNDMLQIIFMGSLLGVAVGALSSAYPGALSVLNCMNSIFSKITTMIVSFLPLAVFCSIGKMIIGMDVTNLMKVLAWIPVNYLGYIPMIGIYCLLIAALGKVNPIHFLRGFSPAMFTAFSLASSNAAMPTSMECCKKLGINRSVYSFSIPLGATINMDGSCIMLMISSLFMAKIFGVTISSGEITTLIIAIMALSIGCPGIPGGTLVCLSILLPQIGIPAEAISLIMGIYTLCSMGFVLVNVTGDAAISTIVAKSENLLDTQQYNSN